MPTTQVATLQTIWDCRWSRFRYRVGDANDRCQPEETWACVRHGDRRRVTEEECERCPYWEALPEPRRLN
jgi:hypothetical protein